VVNTFRKRPLLAGSGSLLSAVGLPIWKKRYDGVESRDEAICLKQFIIRPWVLLALIWVIWMPVSAWAGRSTEGLIYLFLPFYIAIAIFLFGTAASLAYLIACVIRAKKNQFMDIEQAKTTRKMVFRLWGLAVLIWTMLIFVTAPELITSAEISLFGAAIVVIPSLLVGIPLLLFVSIKSQFSR
jgi:hypothetical protein